jgi:hypothetical protein
MIPMMMILLSWISVNDLHPPETQGSLHKY